MNSSEIREKFLKFFGARGHKVVPSSSLVPEGDSSVLFTTAGMQQFKPYYIGAKNAEKDFATLNTASVQKCVRTSDIEEVGDERHLTFFEMLGNFSFGGYWKKEAIEYAHDFVTKEMGLKIDYVTVFEGEGGVPEDKESEEIWKSVDPNITIKKFGRADNFWGPTGEEGPCGPTTEIYVDGIEIWNIVFNEFYQDKNKNLKPLETKGIDTGMGLERLALVSQFPGKAGEVTIFETNLFAPVISKTREVSRGVLDTREERIVADHMRAAAFMLAAAITPSNTERGYILRRLIRRVTRKNQSNREIAEEVIKNYENVYPELKEKKEIIVEEIKKEEERFMKTLDLGLKQFEKGEDPFTLFTSYGFPLDLTKELVRKKGVEIDQKDFEEKFKRHQEISKAGMEQKFKGGLGGHGEMEVKYHTATHLLHQALREVLGSRVEQKGSNITPERLRFDFAHTAKMTDEEKKKVEDIVNQKIKADLPINKIVLSKEEALKTGALHFFGEKYGDEVSVYYIGDSLDSAYSKEFCGGPHVGRTSDLASSGDPELLAKGPFKILKEEAISAGVRRIKAILE